MDIILYDIFLNRLNYIGYVVCALKKFSKYPTSFTCFG